MFDAGFEIDSLKDEISELRYEIAQMRDGWYVKEITELDEGGLRVKFEDRRDGEIKIGIFTRWMTLR